MPEPYYADDLVTLHLGDCLDVMAAMPDASVDAVVTDPPYGLEFMGKEWDAPWQAGTGIGGNSAGFNVKRFKDGSTASLPSYTGSTNPTCRNCGGLRNGREGKKGQHPCRCNAPRFDNITLPRMAALQAWCEAWAAECFRILKPGGHLLAFGGTRTYHRLACGIEDAGFEIRDSLHWMYGSGFPKSLDVSKAIDKAAGAERKVIGTRPQFPDGTRGARARPNACPEVFGDRLGLPGEIPVTAPASPESVRWEGWGTALKPSHEPVIVARKPLAGTVAANVLRWGTGALNVDGCRVGTTDDLNGGAYYGPRRPPARSAWEAAKDGSLRNGIGEFQQPPGRWPPNLLLTHSADCNGACAPGCPVAGLDGQSGTLHSQDPKTRKGGERGRSMFGQRTAGAEYADAGGASRFFPQFAWDPEYDLPFMYCAKAPKSERPQAEGVSTHPTVKPLAVMRWLVRLVTPPGGLVLDPFAGTGTTGQACALEGFRCVLAERDPDSAELARVRLAKPVQQQMTLDLPALPTTE